MAVSAPSPFVMGGTFSVARRYWPQFTALGLAFAALFYQPLVLLLRDWWSNPEAGHGLLLVPVAGWLAWRARGGVALAASPALGGSVIASAVLLRYVSGLGAELFTMRMSMVIALAGLVVYFAGSRRLLAWWLPFTLVVLSIPLPEVLLNSIALPLQFKASRIGSTLLELRHVPVRLNGNVIQLPGHNLFVTEACSGLRSLTALLSLGVLAGGLWLRWAASRWLLLAAAIPVAVLLNGVRVFLTGFLVYFVNPGMGEGFMHVTEGWMMFVAAFGILGSLAWLLATVEERARRPAG